MHKASKAKTVSRTVRLTGFEDKKNTHGWLLSSCVRTLSVVGSRIRPAVLGVASPVPVVRSGVPLTRSDYFTLGDVGAAGDCSRGVSGFQHFGSLKKTALKRER
jgi:hypothetical protein